MWKVEDPHLAIAALRSKTRTDLLAYVTKKNTAHKPAYSVLDD
jgi:hypothetical protein